MKIDCEITSESNDAISENIKYFNSLSLLYLQGTL